jgi:hypothetical protein
MKQQVDIVLKLSLWLDASLDEPQLRTLIQVRLAAGFGKAMSDMLDPVTIFTLRQEAEIYGSLVEFTCFDEYEVHGVREFGKGRKKHCEQVDDHEAQFFSLYGHIPGQGLECIGDFRTREHAEEVYARITGLPYSAVTKKGGKS